MPEPTPLLYRVGTFRSVGLECKWMKFLTGKPFIVVRDPKNPDPVLQVKWVVVSKQMFDLMKEHGVMEGYKRASLLTNFFHI